MGTSSPLQVIIFRIQALKACEWHSFPLSLQASIFSWVVPLTPEVFCCWLVCFSCLDIPNFSLSRGLNTQMPLYSACSYLFSTLLPVPAECLLHGGKKGPCTLCPLPHLLLWCLYFWHIVKLCGMNFSKMDLGGLGSKKNLEGVRGV